MQLFYIPDAVKGVITLPEQESKHAVRVLRLKNGDNLYITDGKGNLYECVVQKDDPKRCLVQVVSIHEQYGKRDYSLTMAVAPTKNNDRYEWFLEKATEVGCDRFVPIECDNSERRVFKTDRGLRVITSAVKQSLKAYHPVLDEMTQFRTLVTQGFDGVKLIAHCKDGLERKFVNDYVSAGDNALILIGPEGDFSEEEINFALSNGFKPVTFGQARLRTETAALNAVMAMAIINQ